MPIKYSSKILGFLKNNKIKFNSINSIKIEAIVTSKDKKYNVTIYRNGKFHCTCERTLYSKFRYKQFWDTDNNLPLITTDECSHVMSIKMTKIYQKWIGIKPNHIINFKNIELDLKNEDDDTNMFYDDKENKKNLLDVFLSF